MCLELHAIFFNNVLLIVLFITFGLKHVSVYPLHTSNAMISLNASLYSEILYYLLNICYLQVKQS